MKVGEVHNLGLRQTHVKSKLKRGLTNFLSPPNEACSWSVDQMPSVGGEVFPANVLGIMPESADLKHGDMSSHGFIFLNIPTLK